MAGDSNPLTFRIPATIPFMFNVVTKKATQPSSRFQFGSLIRLQHYETSTPKNSIIWDNSMQAPIRKFILNDMR